jgi:hypothetical protein
MTRLLLTLSALLCFLAGSSQSGKSDPARAPFSITIRAPRASVTAGSPINISVRLTNTSDRNIEEGGNFMLMGGLDGSYRYDCYDENHRSVNKSYPFIGNLGERPMLKPGASYETSFQISTACDLTRPGSYTIQLSRDYVADSGQRVAVRSNRIIITVVLDDDAAHPFTITITSSKEPVTLSSSIWVEIQWRMTLSVTR